MRVRVVVGLVAEHEVVLLEVADDGGIGVEHLDPSPRWDVGGVSAVLVHRHDRRDPRGVGGDLVLLAETGSQVDDPGALLGRHVVGA